MGIRSLGNFSTILGFQKDCAKKLNSNKKTRGKYFSKRAEVTSGHSLRGPRAEFLDSAKNIFSIQIRMACNPNRPFGRL